MFKPLSSQVSTPFKLISPSFEDYSLDPSRGLANILTSYGLSNSAYIVSLLQDYYPKQNLFTLCKLLAHMSRIINPSISMVLYSFLSYLGQDTAELVNTVPNSNLLNYSFDDLILYYSYKPFSPDLWIEDSNNVLSWVKSNEPVYEGAVNSLRDLDIPLFLCVLISLETKAKVWNFYHVKEDIASWCARTLLPFSIGANGPTWISPQQNTNI